MFTSDLKKKSLKIHLDSKPEVFCFVFVFVGFIISYRFVSVFIIAVTLIINVHKNKMQQL